MQAKEERKDTGKVWEVAALVCLGLTIAGQIVVGSLYLLGIGLWFVSNVLFLVRDFALERPKSDKIKDAALTAITTGLIIVAII